MISDPARLLIATAVLAVALLIGGCNREVSWTRQFQIEGSEQTLDDTYADLLEDAAWTTAIREVVDEETGEIQKERYVTVGGTLSGTHTPFSATYTVTEEGRQPELVDFSVNGKTRDPAKFAEFVSDYYLARGLYNK